MSTTAHALMTPPDFFFTCAAYVLGSLSFAVIVSKLMGIEDPRSYGSKNPGATNVLRSGNKAAAVLTLLGDALKGLAAVLIAKMFGPQFGVDAAGVAWVALAVVAGHMWPIFFNFKGGKGVATAMGVMFGLNLLLGFAVVLTWLLVAFIWRYSSLAAMLSLGLSPLFGAFLLPRGTPQLGITLVIGLLVFYRHRDNLIKLLTRQEKKIGEKARAPADPTQ
ncbi:glycerol-3-phosphate 1-O-acyltransferase PlsY [Paludibacterium purpuratum]|uniref:Glycerol-3-phosphate acyltransferase n=1 Tax=Paludibacterium purpuratum TaxID=1144873 RepID=A0A4R7B618_9NEIS|nr:glycerol-3-phosphate 1-O-acyltransferase PlsY [Paludibacterium purpuratum]TDR78343.1 acyl-phosphate glycerol-3-phosphate acyltransferase [Paludibacterium purpuratum]